MATYTPEELEAYRKWFESQNPVARSLDEQIENQRKLQGAAELVARGERAAKKPVATLGELVPEIKETRIPSAAELSAKTFEEANELPAERSTRKAEIERSIREQSRSGKLAKESAEVFTASDIDNLNKKLIERDVSGMAKSGKSAAESANVFKNAGLVPLKSAAESAEVFSSMPDVKVDDVVPSPQIKNTVYSNPIDYNKLNFQPDELVETKNLSTGNKRLDSLISKVGGGVESGGKGLSRATGVATSKLPPAIDKLAKLGLAKEVYDAVTGEGDLTSAGLSLGSAAASKLSRGGPLVSAILEAIKPTEMGGGTYDELEKRLSSSDPKKAQAAREQLQEIGRRTWSGADRTPAANGSDSPKKSVEGAGDNFIPFKSLEDKLAFQNDSSPKNNPGSIARSPATSGQMTSVSDDVDTSAAESRSLSKIIEETTKKPQETDILALLEKAKQSRDKQQLLANLGMAGETLSSAIGGMVSGGTITKPTGTDFYKNLAKQAEDRISDLGSQVTLQEKQEDINKAVRRRDPSSDESMLAKETYKELFNKPAPENLTAEAFEKIAPTMTNLMSQREARRAREAEIEQRDLDREILREKGYNEKQEKAIINARDEVKTKGYKDAYDMYKNAERLFNTLENLSPGMYGDVIRTLQSAKLFQGDASVVRGPELKELQGAVGVLDRLKNEVDRLKGTGKLQAKQRKEIQDVVNTIKNVSKKEYTGLLRPAALQFSRRGLPLEEIFDPRVLPEVQESLGLKTSEIETQTKKVIRRGYNKTTNQTQLIYDDGTSEIVEGKR